MAGLCSACPHPGGEKLTRRMLALACLKPGQRVLDLGCGRGETLRLLQSLGLNALGLETDPACCDGRTVLHYDGRRLPFPDAFLDGVLMECVLSCAEDPAETLREVRRVLKPAGTLAVSDLTAKGEKRTVPVSPLRTEEGYRGLYRDAGFCVYHEEDASDGLLQLFGQLLFDGGEAAVQQALGLTKEERKRMRPGYHLWILTPDQVLALEEKTRDLPFTSEEALMGDRPRLLAAEPKDIARIITVNTSGSTGPRKRIYFTDGDLQKTADFFTPGMAPMIGAGDRVLVFMRGTGTYSIAGLLSIAVERLGGTVRNYGEVKDLEDAAKAAENAECLVMMPGDAAALAALYPRLRPKSVLLSADHISRSAARRVTRAWKCRLFLHWGMTETGYGGAVTAAPEGPYLFRRDLYAETIDPASGRRLSAGELGELVITMPEREGMPLIRYRTGDRARLAVDKNGRQVLTDLPGRLSDEVLLPEGQRISIHSLDELLYEEEDLAWYEAALTKGGLLRIGWLGTEAPKDAGGSLPERLDRRIRAKHNELKTEFYPAAFRTGKRKLRMEDEDRSDL